MYNALSDMMSRYPCQTRSDYKHALHECIQEIVLLGLWRSKFFEHAAFYGGTALRILYGLPRFSEDLDFSLLSSGSIQLAQYNQAIKSELLAFGLDVEVDEKAKTTPIQFAFIKANAKKQLLVIEAPPSISKHLPQDQLIKIKMEVDTDPPGDFETESKYCLNPTPFSVNTYTLPNLFAGKLHAMLCRQWKTRIKGRDWYDFIWYVKKNVQPNLAHLEARLRQSGHYTAKDALQPETLHQMLQEKIHQIDFELAKQDVAPFIRDHAELTVWSQPFFLSLVGNLI